MLHSPTLLQTEYLIAFDLIDINEKRGRKYETHFSSLINVRFLIYLYERSAVTHPDSYIKVFFVEIVFKINVSQEARHYEHIQQRFIGVTLLEASVQL